MYFTRSGFFVFCGVEESGGNFKAMKKKELCFSFMNKKGMEMWQLILIILAVLLLFFVIFWYSGLNTKIAGFFARLSNLL